MSAHPSEDAMHAAQSWLSTLGNAMPHFNHAGVATAVSRDDDENGLLALESAFARDPVLAAQLLRVANSPLFGLSRKLDSIGKALTVVGVASAKSILLYHCMQMDAKLPNNNAVANRIIMHSVISGICASHLAEHNHVSPESAFLSGLIHDIGQLTLLANRQQDVQPLYEQADADNVYVIEQETALMGFSHLELGAALAKHWNFPSQLVSAVLSHHSACPEMSFNHAVAVGCLLADLSCAGHFKLTAMEEAVHMQCLDWGLGEYPLDHLPAQAHRDMAGVYKSLSALVTC